MQQFKGLIFDMDGVIVDNHQYHFKAWMEFSRKYQFPLNAEIYRDQYNGRTNAELFRMIFGKISVTEIQNYATEKESFYQNIYSEYMRPHTGLLDFLDYLSAKKIKLAVGTSAPTMNVDFTLDRLSLRKYFHAIVDGPQVLKGKPDPEVYLKCAEKLGVTPDSCVVFEDSLAGLESGKRAGCKIVGVATSHTSSELKALTDIVIQDFTQARGVLGL